MPSWADIICCRLISITEFAFSRRWFVDKQQICTKLVMDVLGLDFSVNSFQDRLILQKSIYLAQAAGVNLGYYFGWYLHGPYCSAVASDGFAVQDDLKQNHDESKGWELNDALRGKLGKVTRLFQEKDRGKLARNLELLASVHFLVERGQASESDEQHIYSTLVRFKKVFSIEEVTKALKQLRDYDFLS